MKPLLCKKQTKQKTFLKTSSINSGDNIRDVNMLSSFTASNECLCGYVVFSKALLH